MAAELLQIAPLLETQLVQPMASAYSSILMLGTSANQTLNATSAKPFVAGMGGNDTLHGDGGDNLLIGDYFAAAFLD